MKEQLTYAAYATGWGLVKRLPEPAADALFARIADVAWRRRGKSVLRLESNLRRVRPELDDPAIRRLSREGMRSYLRYWCESFRMPVWSQDKVTASFDPAHIERLDDTLASGRGVILALPHMGNWDLAGAWVVARGYPFTTVAERLKPEKLFDAFVAYREGLGMEVLPLTGGANTLATLAKRLRAGKLVCLVGDRDLSASGVEVQFQGAATRMPAGPAALAQQTGAALLPVTLWYDGTKTMKGCVHEEIQVPEHGSRREKTAAMTQAMADVWAEGVREHAKDWHMLQRFWLADLEPREPVEPREPLDPPTEAVEGPGVRIGIVCPYAWDVPGGVQFHVRDLAEHLIGLGHEVSVLAPADDDTPLPPYVTSAGRAVPVPYNGSVARLNFGFLSAARVRRWLHEGRFEVLHIHEPATPSLSLLACWAASGPIVATFHTSNPRSRAMIAAEPILQPALEKISARIAVSEYARTTLVEHLGGDAVVIPNGVDGGFFSSAEPRPEWQGETIGFVGRINEPRKGLPTLLEALPAILAERPAVRLLVAGKGDEEEAVKDLPQAVRDRITFLGMVSDEEKARLLRSVTLYVAPNTGGESFGIILVEALSAGAPVVASDLDAFRQVLDGGSSGELFPVEDASALAEVTLRLLGDPKRREALSDTGSRHVRRFDWSTVGADILAVYETVTQGAAAVTDLEPSSTWRTRLGLARD